MRNLSIRLLGLVVLLCGIGQVQAQDKIRVIIIDGQNNHNWRATTPIMKKALEDCGKFTVAVSSNLKSDKEKPGDVPTVQFPPDLSKYDVVLSNYNGAGWPKAFNDDLDDPAQGRQDRPGDRARGQQFVRRLEGIQPDDRHGLARQDRRRSAHS